MSQCPLNLSEIFEAKDELQEVEHYIKQIIRGLPGAFYICDAEGRIMYYNEVASELWGRDPEIGKDMWCGSWKIFKPDGSSIPLDSCPMAIALKEGRPVNGHEIVVVRPDGMRRNVLPHPRPIFSASGAIAGAFNILVDITEHKQVEKRVLENEQFMRRMIASSNDCIKVLDLDLRLVSMNDGGKCLLELDDITPFIGRYWLDFWTGKERAAASKAVETAKNGGIGKFSGCFYTFKTRTLKWLDVVITPIPNAEGHTERLLAVSRDITEYKLLQHQLKHNNKELKKINRDLDNFIYTASHDLKAPVLNIEGLIVCLKEALQDASLPLNNEIETLLQMIDRSISRFKLTILDLTEISKVQRQLEEEVHEVKCDEVIADVVLSINDDIKKSGASVTVDTTSCNTLSFSRKNFKSIVFNLLSNAIKYRDTERRPEIIIKTESISDKMSLLTVQDNGLGIQAEYLPKMFTMFKRFHDHVDGTGIGLYIVKRIVDNNNGKIEVQSEVNKGTTFKVYFKG